MKKELLLENIQLDFTVSDFNQKVNNILKFNYEKINYENVLFFLYFKEDKEKTYNEFIKYIIKDKYNEKFNTFDLKEKIIGFLNNNSEFLKLIDEYVEDIVFRFLLTFDDPYNVGIDELIEFGNQNYNILKSEDKTIFNYICYYRTAKQLENFSKLANFINNSKVDIEKIENIKEYTCKNITGGGLNKINYFVTLSNLNSNQEEIYKIYNALYVSDDYNYETSDIYC